MRSIMQSKLSIHRFVMTCIIVQSIVVQETINQNGIIQSGTLFNI